MILNFEGQHAGDVIMAMPIITSLRRSGVDVKVYVAKQYQPFLYGFDLKYIDKPIGPPLTTYNINSHITEFWLEFFNVPPMRMEIEANYADPSVVLSPDSRILARRLPHDFWKEIVEWCKKRNLTVTIIGPDDAIDSNNFLDEYGVINLTGKQTIQETYATLKHAIAVVTTDTGTSHLSDALNDVTITAFKRNNDNKFAPYWNRRVVKTSEEAIKQLETLINKSTNPRFKKCRTQ